MMAESDEGRGKPGHAQLCQSLLHLYDAADNVFNTILSRVKSEQEKLSNLTARITEREAQIAALAGTKEAITLFSSAKYVQVPTEQINFVPLFGGKQAEFPIATISLDAGQYQDGEGGTLELFRFFSETNHEYWPREFQSAEGIGRMPKNIKSVADSMLFNSSELPYHLYRVVDNLAGADIVVGEEEPKHKPPPLAAPPQSVLAGDALTTSGVQEYGFRPMLGEVPSFSLPSSLPNLPMVADISWNGSSHQSHSRPFAPSVGHYRTASIGDSSAEGTPTKSDTRSLDSSTRGFEDFVAPAPSALSIPQPPVLTLIQSSAFPVNPLPLPLPKSEASQTSGSSRLPTILTKTKNIEAAPSFLTQETRAKTSAPPPPPPPPPRPSPPPPPPPPMRSPVRPIQIEKPTASNSERPESSKQTDVVGSSSLPSPIVMDVSRAALMESIRNHGFQLRKTVAGDQSTAVDKVQPSSAKQIDSNRAQPLNLLSEMANTLKLRRLSMQGASHDKDQVKPSKILGNEDTDATSVSSESNSAGITLPIKNLHDYIAKKNQEDSDDDDWEE